MAYDDRLLNRVVRLNPGNFHRNDAGNWLKQDEIWYRFELDEDTDPSTLNNDQLIRIIGQQGNTLIVSKQLKRETDDWSEF